MVGCVKHLVRIWLLLLLVWNVGCTCGPTIVSPPNQTTTTTTGEGGGDEGPCGVDCASIQTPPCTMAVCNTGQLVGPINTCVVIQEPNGNSCDDGQFCTINDTCNNGVCVGGGKSTCGLPVSPCVAVICYEDSKTCDSTPVNDGAGCTPEDLCQVNGVCQLGNCVGEPKDCTFSPLNECNVVGCDPDTGKCVGMPDPKKDDLPCVLTGDVCSINKTCKAGKCEGGTPKDCSALNIGCSIGVCDSQNGVCKPTPAPVGTSCSEGLHECDVGACDVKGTCVPSPAADGIACNDHSACTTADECLAGECSGSPIAGCNLYLEEGFESCPNGWTFGGDWECGEPTNVGPIEAHTGEGVIATQVGGIYHVNQSYASAFADSPPIDLTKATSPVLSFWAWVHTEGGTFDGWNLKISTDGGGSFTQVTTVTPDYDLTIAGQAAWGGNHSTESWQHYSADLAAYAGETVVLRFAFRSDGATVYPGVYIDDIVIAEPQESPIFITTDSPLMDGYAQQEYTALIEKTGGTAGSVWSIKPGGTNTAWLTIDPATGLLGGTPSAAEVGPVSVTVHVEEPLLPSNFVEKTFTFKINQAKYYTSFEGVCPGGWTLTGDWQCGAPMNVGPLTPFVGSQCIGTVIDGLYSNLQTYASTTATSPDIDLTGVISPVLTFRMWVDTEGSTYDGVNLQISTDGGMNYTILDTVTPAYPLTVAGKPAWGGHQGALNWQLVEANLGVYAGQIIRLRFSFQADSSGVFPGVYIDDILVN